MRIGYVEGTRFGKRFAKFPQQGVFHGLKMKLLLSTYVQGEPANFDFGFAEACTVSVIFGPAGQEFHDHVAMAFPIVQFVGHLAEKITQGNFGFTGAPFVHHGIGVEI